LREKKKVKQEGEIGGKNVFKRRNAVKKEGD